MLNKILPPGSRLRNRLRYLFRKLNFAMSPELRQNFTQPNVKQIERLRTLLIQKYFPSWYQGIDAAKFVKMEEGRRALANHLELKLNLDRFDFIPWINAEMKLKNARVLEIGCGTGCSTVSLAEQGAKVTALDVHDEALQVASLFS